MHTFFQNFLPFLKNSVNINLGSSPRGKNVTTPLGQSQFLTKFFSGLRHDQTYDPWICNKPHYWICYGRTLWGSVRWLFNILPVPRVIPHEWKRLKVWYWSLRYYNLSFLRFYITPLRLHAGLIWDSDSRRSGTRRLDTIVYKWALQPLLKSF